MLLHCHSHVVRLSDVWRVHTSSETPPITLAGDAGNTLTATLFATFVCLLSRGCTRPLAQRCCVKTSLNQSVRQWAGVHVRRAEALVVRCGLVSIAGLHNRRPRVSSSSLLMYNASEQHIALAPPTSAPNRTWAAFHLNLLLLYWCRCVCCLLPCMATQGLNSLYTDIVPSDTDSASSNNGPGHL